MFSKICGSTRKIDFIKISLNDEKFNKFRKNVTIEKEIMFVRF